MRATAATVVDQMESLLRSRYELYPSIEIMPDKIDTKIDADFCSVLALSFRLRTSLHSKSVLLWESSSLLATRV